MDKLDKLIMLVAVCFLISTALTFHIGYQLAEQQKPIQFEQLTEEEEKALDEAVMYQKVITELIKEQNWVPACEAQRHVRILMEKVDEDLLKRAKKLEDFICQKAMENTF